MGADRGIGIGGEAAAGSPVARREHRLESVALFLLLLGAPLGFSGLGGMIPALLLWLVGVGLLWRADAWSVREKMLGTVALPGGLLPLLLALLAGAGTARVHAPGRSIPRPWSRGR